MPIAMLFSPAMFVFSHLGHHFQSAGHHSILLEQQRSKADSRHRAYFNMMVERHSQMWTLLRFRVCTVHGIAAVHLASKSTGPLNLPEAILSSHTPTWPRIV